MVAKNRGLGRGLDALLGGVNTGTDLQSATPEKQSSADTNLTTLPLDLIQRGRYQPRRSFDQDKLNELADSIAAQGVIQPIVVRAIEDGNYELIAGERRWRAAQQAGLVGIPVVIRDVSEQQAMAMGLIENIQRDDLNPLEQATALHRLLEEFSLTHQQIAEAIGKSRASVTNYIRLLELNADVKILLESSQMEMGHAKALLGLHDEVQSQAAREVVQRGLSVRETEKLVRRLLNGEPAPVKEAAREEDPDVRRLQNELSERLGAQVNIQQGNKGTGKLTISYNSLDELEGILEHIK